MKIGIDAISFDLPKIYLPIKDLAERRQIEPEKLEKGLGLKRMTLADAHQDTVVFGANAFTRLIEEHEIDLSEIARIYVGTESGVDNSKPVASYIAGLIEQKFGNAKLLRADAVDFTFACIGAVDAMQTCVDFIRLNPTKKAVVIATDIAKYDLGSTGEYTQGAGAVAFVLSKNPKIIAFDFETGVSHQSVFDFFKPYRTVSKFLITGNDENHPWFGNLEGEIEIHKDQPVFDGQYSNQCYTDRTREAYEDFQQQTGKSGYVKSWSGIIMHLPYAFQGRRMLTELYAKDHGIDLPENPEECFGKLKELAKSEEYKAFVTEKLAPAEAASSLIGNLYTGSIFMGFLSDLAKNLASGNELSGKTYGFLAYGSGSKSKVFQGEIQPDWASVVKKSNLFQTIENARPIDFETYEKLHTKMQHNSVVEPSGEWVLDRIERDKPNLAGARFYQWIG